MICPPSPLVRPAAVAYIAPGAARRAAAAGIAPRTLAGCRKAATGIDPTVEPDGTFVGLVEALDDDDVVGGGGGGGGGGTALPLST